MSSDADFHDDCDRVEVIKTYIIDTKFTFIWSLQGEDKYTHVYTFSRFNPDTNMYQKLTAFSEYVKDWKQSSIVRISPNNETRTWDKLPLPEESSKDA